MSTFSNTFTPVAIGFLLLAAGQSALASQPPCNKRLYERASIACHGNGNCIARTYFQSDFNVKAFMQCKADQWNQMFGDNKTVDELFNSKNTLPFEPSSSKALDAGTYSTQPFTNSRSIRDYYSEVNNFYPGMTFNRYESIVGFADFLCNKKNKKFWCNPKIKYGTGGQWNKLTLNMEGKDVKAIDYFMQVPTSRDK